MEILWEYRIGMNLQRLLEMYWEGQTVVLWSKGYYGRPFKIDRGVTQGYSV